MQNKSVLFHRVALKMHKMMLVQLSAAS